MTNVIVQRELASGKLLEIAHDGGRLLIAYVDGKKVSSGGLTAMPEKLKGSAPGCTSLACGNVPVTVEEAEALQEAIDIGQAVIDKRMAEAKAYNDLINEGGEGYTPYNY